MPVYILPRLTPDSPMVWSLRLPPSRRTPAVGSRASSCPAPRSSKRAMPGRPGNRLRIPPPSPRGNFSILNSLVPRRAGSRRRPRAAFSVTTTQSRPGATPFLSWRSCPAAQPETGPAKTRCPARSTRRKDPCPWPASRELPLVCCDQAGPLVRRYRRCRFASTQLRSFAAGTSWFRLRPCRAGSIRLVAAYRRKPPPFQRCRQILAARSAARGPWRLSLDALLACLRPRQRAGSPIWIASRRHSRRILAPYRRTGVAPSRCRFAVGGNAPALCARTRFLAARRQSRRPLSLARRRCHLDSSRRTAGNQPFRRCRSGRTGRRDRRITLGGHSALETREVDPSFPLWNSSVPIWQFPSLQRFGRVGQLISLTSFPDWNIGLPTEYPTFL